jgi:hypothetical protein
VTDSEVKKKFLPFSLRIMAFGFAWNTTANDANGLTYPKDNFCQEKKGRPLEKARKFTKPDGWRRQPDGESGFALPPAPATPPATWPRNSRISSNCNVFVGAGLESARL